MTAAPRALEMEIDRRALAARFAVLRAGKLAWDYFERGIEHELKADQTPVTIADREAEQLLRDTFHQRFPGDGFLGEEYGEEPSATGFRWIIDPIDGTKNYVRGVPVFATLVGLEWDGAMVAGFAYVPAMDRLYHAVRGGGAFRNDRPIRASTVDRLEKVNLVYTSIDWFDKTGTTPFFLDLVRVVERSRGFGDYFGFLLVAEGAADIVLEPQIAPWDIAALKPIVEEAGGTFTNWHGVDTIYGPGALAGNPAIHAEVLRRLAHPC